MKSGDEHYTPPAVYEAVKKWLHPRTVYHNYVRPFYPGGDYESFDYSEGGTIVLDNPPFSKLTEIINFYIEKDVPFFLFAPNNTAFNLLQRGRHKVLTIVVISDKILYESGLLLSTSFVTNLRLSPDKTVILSGTLSDAIKKAQGKKKMKAHHEETVKNAAEMKKYVVPGKDIVVKYSEVLRKDANGVQLYGSGIRLSEETVARVEVHSG